jgi:hypothetical protein
MVLQDISFDENDAVKKVYVVYRIRSDHLVPQAVTSDLGVEPTRTITKGEKYLGNVFDIKTNSWIKKWSERQFSLWDIDSKSLQQFKKVKEHVGYLLSVLEPHFEQIHPYLLQEEEYIISFYIRWELSAEHGSYIIPGELLRRMGKLCHFVEFSYISNIGSNE